VIRAQDGDEVARAAALMLRKALTESPQLVTSQTALEAAQSTPALPAYYSPRALPPAPSSAPPYSASSDDYPGDGDGTQALINSMTTSGFGAESPCHCN
jgi:hypothetical protein